MMSSILGLLLLSLSQVCVCQEFSWGASDYYMGWSGGYSWEQSRDKCKARGSGWDLAAIETSTENRGLEKILLDYCEVEQGDLALCCFLLGGYDINSSTDMKLTTGEAASYFNWSGYYEEPNDTPGSCLYMCVENYFGISGEWGDKSCSETGTTKYLCEKS